MDGGRRLGSVVESLANAQGSRGFRGGRRGAGLGHTVLSRVPMLLLRFRRVRRAGQGERAGLEVARLGARLPRPSPMPRSCHARGGPPSCRAFPPRLPATPSRRAFPPRTRAARSVLTSERPPPHQTASGGVLLWQLLLLLSLLCWVLAHLRSSSEHARGSKPAPKLWRVGWTALGGAVLLAAAALLIAEPMLASPSLVSTMWVQGWQQGLVAMWQQLVVGAVMLYPACVSVGLLLELLTPHLHRLEAPLRAMHKTRDCVACLFLFAPLFALGSHHSTRMCL